MMLSLMALLGAASLAAIMGFAIQRGATCTVAAVEELMHERKAQRLLGLMEASSWVGGGLLIAHSLGWLMQLPAGRVLGWQTVAGAALLGVGAFVNRACVFGAVARLASGEWAYLAAPFGFYLGCVAFAHLPHGASPPLLEGGSLVLQAPGWVAVWVACAMAWRVVAGVRAAGQNASLDERYHKRLLASAWSPGPATVVIGVAFLFLLLIAGAWAYTDVLAEWARGAMGANITRMLLLFALFGGAAWGGWTAGRFRFARPRPAQIARCLIGGALMGWGSQWIPGSNDGLILMGVPLLWPYAWVALLTMGASIAISIKLQRALALHG